MTAEDDCWSRATVEATMEILTLTQASSFFSRVFMWPSVAQSPSGGTFLGRTNKSYRVVPTPPG